MTSKLVALAAIMMVLTFIDASGGAALAQLNTYKTLICPAGTCGKNGGTRPAERQKPRRMPRRGLDGP